ncbi:MAG: molybdopterin converting factor subunit 1 [Nitrospinae bacterium]|jgi:molybdopterin converting factor subunit 1|nr:molybdopterin converting factor subunit 1 [Nitrospinota bacterium]MDA1108193.1 molybdopterin converting factor subunit 1 [Nitrospinota bacterium]
MITLKYFASLKTIAGKEEEQLDVGSETTVQALSETLSKTAPQISEMIRGKKILVSVNQDVAALDTIIHDGDEVAFLPPFSGGSL